MPTKSFENLLVWQEGHKLVVEVYRISTQFPRDEMFGLTNQIRRAAVSVTSNIAEGFSRNTNKDKLQFYYISMGSLKELKNQLIVARDFGYLDHETFEGLNSSEEMVGRLLSGLIRSVRNGSS